ARQPVARESPDDPDAEQPADHRAPVQEQVGYGGAHGAARADHAAPRPAAERGRGASAARGSGALPQTARVHRRRRQYRRPGDAEARPPGAEAMTPLAPRAVRASSRLAAGERGVVLIQVALASLVLFGICSLVVDYGVMWVARAQAQNAADAGALA